MSETDAGKAGDLLRVLVFGASGMLGHKVCQVLKDRFDVWGTIRGPRQDFLRYGILDETRIIGRVDAVSSEDLVQAIATIKPGVVINCAGIVKQSPTMNDPLLPILVNSVFPHHLAAACKDYAARLIHISTDCVFSGSVGMYSEDHTPDPVDRYGMTKLLGEVSGDGCLTLRTSIIGRELRSSLGLVEWLLGQRERTVPGYCRCLFSGFTTAALARIIAEIIGGHENLSGIYHVSSAPIDKWNLLQKLNGAYRVGVYVRPDHEMFCDRSLDSSRFQKKTEIALPSWASMIEGLATDETPYVEWRRE